MRNQNQDVDEVSTGLVLVIVALLLLLFSSVRADFFYVDREITGYEDKITRIPSSIEPQVFDILGILMAIIGFAIFSKHFVNNINESLSRELDNKSHH
ncbi:MAG: hypothetical protein M8353_00760 [ANME-2 cluster archaeon]|nr:hypothetical protein [ANME-2 cluster archaeon]